MNSSSHAPNSKRSENVALCGLIAVVVLIMGALIWFRVSLQDQLAYTILDSIHPQFAEIDLYPMPTPGFGEKLKQLDQKSRWQHPEILRLVVTVLIPEGEGKEMRERIVYPDSLLFGSEEARAKLPRNPFLLEDKSSGTAMGIYIDVTLSRSQRYNMMLAALAGAILILAAVVGWRILQQEKRITRDSIELHAIKGELAKLERRALVGQITASLIHDLKKPVLHIRDEAASGDASQRTLEEIGRNSTLFLNMIRDLKLENFLSGDSAPQQYLYLDDVVEQSFRLVQREAVDLSFENKLPDNLPLVLAVPHRLIQIFSNLFLNSIQAMDGRGRIEVSGRVLENISPVRIEVLVRDSGPGIPSRALPYIFEPFYSTGEKEASCGLGLYICRSLMEESGGLIERVAGDGSGAAFRLEFTAHTRDD
jgi:signal transduction histidine kinase